MIDRSLTALIASVRLRCFNKASPRDFPDTDVTLVLNEQAGSFLTSAIRPFRKNYGVVQADQSLVINQTDYPLPVRAHAGTIQAMALVDPLGKLPAWALKELDLSQSIGLPTNSNQNTPSFYSILGDYVRLSPAPTTSNTPYVLRIQYVQRPNQLVDVSTVGVVSSVVPGSPGSYVVTCTANVPSTFVTGASVEFVSARPNYSVQGSAGVINAVSGNVVTVAGTAPATVVAGDYFCLFDQAPVLTGVPPEFADVLIQMTALKLMEAKGDMEAVQRLSAGLKATLESLEKNLQYRNAGAREYLSAWGPTSPGWGWPTIRS